MASAVRALLSCWTTAVQPVRPKVIVEPITISSSHNITIPSLPLLSTAIWAGELVELPDDEAVCVVFSFVGLAFLSKISQSSNVFIKQPNEPTVLKQILYYKDYYKMLFRMCLMCSGNQNWKRHKISFNLINRIWTTLYEIRLHDVRQWVNCLEWFSGFIRLQRFLLFTRPKFRFIISDS